MCRSMIYVSDVQKAAAAFAQDMKENSMEDGFGGSSPRRVYSSPTPLSLHLHGWSSIQRQAVATVCLVHMLYYFIVSLHKLQRG